MLGTEDTVVNKRQLIQLSQNIQYKREYNQQTVTRLKMLHKFMIKTQGMLGGINRET